MTSSSGAPPELSPEEEAKLDADPLQRIYDMNKIEAPSQLATVLGCFTKLIIEQQREDIADFGVEYFDHLKIARASDQKIDFDKFISAQLKVLEKKFGPFKYDLATEFNPPEQLQPILTAFSMEVIRYQPNDLFAFALDYFKTLADDGTPDEFLRKQAKLAEEKQKELDLEKKRNQIAKEKSKKKAISMN